MGMPSLYLSAPASHIGHLHRFQGNGELGEGDRCILDESIAGYWPLCSVYWVRIRAAADM